MDALVERATKAAASDVLREAAKEVTGRSNRRWGLIVVALVFGVGVGIVVGLIVAARMQSSGDDEQGASG